MTDNKKICYIKIEKNPIKRDKNLKWSNKERQEYYILIII